MQETASALFFFFFFTSWGRAVGRARVTVLPESGRVVTGFLFILTVRVGVLGGFAALGGVVSPPGGFG